MVVHESRNIGLWPVLCLFLGNLCHVLLKLWRFDTTEWMVEIQFDALCIKVLSTVFHMRSSAYACIKCILLWLLRVPGWKYVPLSNHVFKSCVVISKINPTFCYSIHIFFFYFISCVRFSFSHINLECQGISWKTATYFSYSYVYKYNIQYN